MILYRLNARRATSSRPGLPAAPPSTRRRSAGCSSCPQLRHHQGVEGADGAAHRQARQAKAAAKKEDDEPADEAPAKPETQRVAAHRELAAAMRKLRAEVEAKSEYVGPRFSEEARKIHYEEVPARGIHGEATAEEAKALKEEGIEFFPLPTLPEDRN